MVEYKRIIVENKDLFGWVMTLRNVVNKGANKMMNHLIFKINYRKVKNMLRNIRKICVLIIILVLLCSCNVIQESERDSISIPSERETAVSELNVSESSETEKEYYFEPSVSIIEGKLITRMCYGPPGYGENPSTDAQEHPFILQLDDPIQVIAQEGDLSNSDRSEVIEIQVVPMNKEDTEIVKQYINKRIIIQGTLFSAHTGHHHTDVLIQVEKILD